MAKEIIKEAVKKVEPKKQRLVRADNVERRKKEGWTVVHNHTDKKQVGLSDLVLMEK